MKHLTSLIGLLLAITLAAPALADSTTSGLTSGGTIQTQDEWMVYRPSNPGTNFRVNIGSAGTQSIGTSGAVVPLLNGVNTWSGLQNFLSGDLAAADPVFSGGSITLPAGTTGQRPGSPVNGMIRYNSTTPGVEGYVNGTWGPLGGSSSSALTGLTGDVLASGPGSVAATLATVNSNVGTFGSASVVPQITIDAKGRITSSASVTITPSAIGAAPVASPTFTGTVTAPAFVGSLTGNASTVTTNANLTGDVTSTGNATTLSASTVTGKALTGFSASAGTVSATDTILSAFNKIVANIAALLPSASPTFTGTLSGANESLSGTSTAAGGYTGNLTGNVSGTAAGITGVGAVAHGGTGASTPSAAVSNLLSNPPSGTYSMSCTGSACTPVAASTGGGSPAGNAAAVQYNNSGAFAGASPNTETTTNTVLGNQSLVLNQQGTVPVFAGTAPTYTTYQAFGDSITNGTGATSYLYAYPSLIAQDLNASLANYGVPGDTSCDQNNRQIFKYALTPSTPGHNPLSTLAVGLNDSGQKGTGAGEVIFHNCHQAEMEWLTIPANYKTLGQACTQTGTWTADTNYVTGAAIVSATNGSTLSCPITTTGGPIYAWYRDIDGGTGTFTYSVDGGTAVSVSTATSSLTTSTISSNGGTTSAMFPIRLTGISAGSHTVVFSVTSATSAGNTVSIAGVGTPPPANTFSTADLPILYSAGVSQLAGSQSTPAATTYNADSLADANLLIGDGLNIKFVDIRQLWLASDYSSDSTHPNNAGHNHLRDSFERVMRFNPGNPAAVYAQNGTYAYPSITFQNQPGTGLYVGQNGAGDTALWVTAGQNGVASFTSTGNLELGNGSTNRAIHVGTGTPGTPAYSFTNANNMGLYYDSTNSGDCLATNGYAGFCVYRSGLIVSTPQIGPSVAAGAGAGTSPTIAVAGSNLAHTVSLTTGTSPPTTGALFTVTYGYAAIVAPQACHLTPMNSASALVITDLYETPPTTAGYTLNVNGTALAAATAYKWALVCF